MSSSFTPSNAIDTSNEKTWSASLGMLDWDTTNIVFTKRSLIEFLKNVPHRTTVDPNFATIAKLPRYAKFGTISKATSDAPTESGTETTNATIDPAPGAGNDFRPSRRVRATPGGVHTNIFGQDDDDDALASAPPRQDSVEASSRSRDILPQPYPPVQQEQIPSGTANDTSGTAATASPAQTSTSEFRPTRRVRTNPGGTSTIGTLFGNDDEQGEFKPTRRVREGPGGQDHIGRFY